MVKQNWNFQHWVETTEVTDDGVGDFIADARRAPQDSLKWIRSENGLRNYLVRNGACRECLELVPEIWTRFQHR